MRDRPTRAERVTFRPAGRNADERAGSRSPRRVPAPSRGCRLATGHSLVGLLWGWCAITGVVASVAAQEPTAAEERAFLAAVERVAGAVVRLEPVGGSAATLGSGAEAVPGSGPTSGLVIDSAGWIVTTAFGVPVDTKDVVVVRGDGSRLAARVVGRDAARGLVLVRSESLAEAPALEMAPRAGLAPGQWAIGIGRGWTHTSPNVSVGIISAVNRAWGRGVQTDAATSPANYGGALVDIRGRVIGLVAPLPADTAGMPTGTELYDAGIGFAVPLEDILAVRARLETGETLEPGLLGIAYRSDDRINGEAVIGSCRHGGPADGAGLRPGDRIVAVDGQPVTRIADVRHALGRRFSGDAVAIEVQRGGAPVAVDVKLVASLPAWRRAIVGVVPVAGAGQGVTVGWVLPGSPAATSGLAAGDVLQSVMTEAGGGAGVRITLDDASALAGVLSGLEPGSRVSLGRKRGDQTDLVECVTAPAPADLPADLPAAIEIDPRGGLTGESTVVVLGGADVDNPAVAVMPSGEGPRGVLVYLGTPHGRATEAEAEPWRGAAGRHGVVVVIPGSTEADRWSRGDIAGIERALAALQTRVRIDPTRLACAGRAAGGGFAWLVGERIAAPVRGMAIWDASLPRQAQIRSVEPGAGLWVLLGQGRGDAARLVEDDRRRLEAAGITVGTLPVAGDAPPADVLCGWVTLLGLL